MWVDYAGHDAPITPKPGLVLAVSSGTAMPAAMRAAGAATIFFDLHLNDRVGTTVGARRSRRRSRPRRSASSTSPCRSPAARPADRGERALRRADGDAVERDERAVPRERAAAPAGARQPRRDDRADDREPAVHRRRRRRLVARDGEGRDPRPPGLLHLARPEGPLRARPRAREPGDAPGDARPDLTLRADRDPGRPRRARAAVPVGAGPGRPARAAAEVGVARDREAAGARREAGRGGDEDPGRLVVGLAELLGRRRRPRQAGRGMRLPLGARPEALRWPGARGRRLQRLAHGGPDRSCRRRCAARSARVAS